MKEKIWLVTAALMVLLLLVPVGCGKAETQKGSLAGGKIKILSQNMTVHEFTGEAPQSTAVVTGRAQNVSDATATFVIITVKFYDKDGNSIATAAAIRENLGPGEMWDFSAKTVGPDAWKIVSYNIAASTRQ